MKYLYLFINLLFNNHLKLLQTNSFCCKLIAGLLCWFIQDKTCSKSGHFTSYCWYDANVTPLGAAVTLAQEEPRNKRVGEALLMTTCLLLDDAMARRCGHMLWTLVEPILMLGGAGSEMLRHSASNRDILGLSFFFSNSTHHTHNPQTQLACSGTLTEQRPCISGSEV